jgi:hypothetical protein
MTSGVRLIGFNQALLHAGDFANWTPFPTSVSDILTCDAMKIASSNLTMHAIGAEVQEVYPRSTKTSYETRKVNQMCEESCSVHLVPL